MTVAGNGAPTTAAKSPFKNVQGRFSRVPQPAWQSSPDRRAGCLSHAPKLKPRRRPGVSSRPVQVKCRGFVVRAGVHADQQGSQLPNTLRTTAFARRVTRR